MEQHETRLLSVQVGLPQTRDFEGEAWRTAIFKAPVSERLFLDRTQLPGDKQANRKYHGGSDKAVCCFPVEHYAYWREKLGLGEAFSFGAFGENFTVSGMTEEAVCIGDVYAVGTAKVQVCQPRMPCNNLARKWNRELMPKEMIAQGHSGYYLRVLETGEVGAGDLLTLLERPNPNVTVTLVNESFYRKPVDLARDTRLANLPELASDARWMIRRRLKPTAPES